jgi:hypothetical protein
MKKPNGSMILSGTLTAQETGIWEKIEENLETSKDELPNTKVRDLLETKVHDHAQAPTKKQARTKTRIIINIKK